MQLMKKTCIVLLGLIAFNTNIIGQVKLSGTVSNVNLATDEEIIINATEITNCQIASSKKISIESNRLTIANSKIDVHNTGLLQIAASTTEITFVGDNQINCKNMELLTRGGATDLSFKFNPPSKKLLFLYQNTGLLQRKINLQGPNIPAVIKIGKGG